MKPFYHIKDVPAPDPEKEGNQYQQIHRSAEVQAIVREIYRLTIFSGKRDEKYQNNYKTERVNEGSHGQLFEYDSMG